MELSIETAKKIQHGDHRERGEHRDRERGEGRDRERGEGREKREGRREKISVPKHAPQPDFNMDSDFPTLVRRICFLD